MYERFAKLLCEKGAKPADITKATGLTSTVFSEWKSGKSKPNAEKLVKIARYLNTTVEYLVTGENDIPLPQAPFYSKDEQELLDGYRTLNDIGKASIKAYLAGILQNTDMLATPPKVKKGTKSVHSDI